MREVTPSSFTFIKTNDRKIKHENIFKGQSLQQPASKQIVLPNYSSTSL